LRDKLDQLTRELGEAYQREAATSDVLKVISSSPGELEPVFNAMILAAAVPQRSIDYPNLQVIVKGQPPVGG